MKTKNDHLPLYGVGPIYGGVVAALTIAGIFIGRLPALSGGKLTTFRIPLLVLGIALIALGIFIWVQSVFVSKIDDGIKENRLVTFGIYAWVRNPIYSAILIVCTGVLLIVGNAWLFLLPPLYWLFLTVLMKHTEERWLRDLYGAAYAEYCENVNRCIPWFPRGEKRMKSYTPEKLVAVSRYQKFFPTLPEDVQQDIYSRMGELLIEEADYCDKGNYDHMAQILTSIAMYEVLQKHGASETEAYKTVSEEMWAFLDPSGMQKIAKRSFFLPLMKKIVPLGFSKKSGVGWKYTWHEDDPKDRFHFECNACIYAQILGKRGLLKLGAMCCHADIINYGSLPYTDFIRTKTLCQGGDVCDFLFIRHETDAGDGWERTESI